MTTTKPSTGDTNSRIVFLAGITVMLIAIYQTLNTGAPDKYTAGALLALALGGGVGKVADGLIKGYVQTQIQQANDAVVKEILPPTAPNALESQDEQTPTDTP